MKHTTTWLLSAASLALLAPAANAALFSFADQNVLLAIRPAAGNASSDTLLVNLGSVSAFYNATTMHSLSGDHATLPNFAQDLAVFLLLRGPFAYLGFGWSGCNVVTAFPDELKADVGEPTGFCAETAPNSGVFTREWSKATVTMDCNSYVGTVTPR